MQLGVDSLRRLKLSEEDRAAVLENMQSGVQDLGYRVEEMLVATRLQRQTDVQASTFDWSDMLDEAVGRVADVQRDRINCIASKVLKRCVATGHFGCCRHPTSLKTR